MKKAQRRLESGQSLVEMTLGFIILTFLLTGLVDLGRVYFTYVALEDAVGEAALYLSINPDCPLPGSAPKCADPQNAQWRARHAVGGDFDTLVDWGTVVPQPQVATSAVGGTVTVTIDYNHRLITPIIRGVSSIPLTVSAQQTIVSE